MSNARTIPWETIADWYAKNEQAFRDVMKFEGLRGAVNEVLRLAPEQPELAALREELAEWKARCGRRVADMGILSNDKLDMQLRLTAAEQRNALPEDWADQLFAEMERRFELSRQYHQDHLVNDDTQIGVEFAIEWISAALKPTESGASE